MDWFWQPRSCAQVPDDEKVLFDRIGLPVVKGDEWRREMHRPPGPPILDMQPDAVLSHKITFFWAMSLIVAKHIARRNSDTVARMTGMIARTLTEIDALLERNQPLPGRDIALWADVVSETPAAQLELLDSLVRDAQSLHRELADRGAAVPSAAIPYIKRFFDLVRSMVKTR